VLDRCPGLDLPALAQQYFAQQFRLVIATKMAASIRIGWWSSSSMRWSWDTLSHEGRRTTKNTKTLCAKKS